MHIYADMKIKIWEHVKCIEISLPEELLSLTNPSLPIPKRTLSP